MLLLSLSLPPATPQAQRHSSPQKHFQKNIQTVLRKRRVCWLVFKCACKDRVGRALLPAIRRISLRRRAGSLSVAVFSTFLQLDVSKLVGYTEGTCRLSRCSPGEKEESRPLSRLQYRSPTVASTRKNRAPLKAKVQRCHVFPIMNLKKKVFGFFFHSFCFGIDSKDQVLT